MLKQSLQQKLLQKLSPQQIQLMKLLQVPTMELEARIKQELEANPALEEVDDRWEEESGAEDLGPDPAEDSDREQALEEFDFGDYLDDETPDYKLSVQQRGADEEEREVPFASGVTFRELLIDQLGFQRVEESDRFLAEQIIGNLDDAGYLARDLESMVNDLAFTQGIQVEKAALESALQVVQSLDPAGVGARDLQECLQLQLRRKLLDPEPDTEPERMEAQRDALQVLTQAFEAFAKKHYDRIQRKWDWDEERLKAALEEILRLNPKPGNSGSEGERGTASAVIVPDFLLTVEEDEIRLQLNQRNAPELRVNPVYKDMMRTYAAGSRTDAQQREALAFVKQKVDAARWFVDAILQRQQTLLITMQAIVDLQRAYFLSGDEVDLRPMILKDVADRVGMDISTVSRVANSKYIATPYGTFLLKQFFSEKMTTETGEEVSSREIKKILSEAIQGEDKRKPLPDDRLCQLLNEKGYNIARRTVAKYREQLGIPVARMRKNL